MLRSLASVGRIEDLAQVLSPAFLRVFPVSRVISAFRELAGNYRNDGRFESLRRERREVLESIDLDIEVVDSPQELPAESTQPSDGPRLLELYFRQLYDNAGTLIDLGRARFGRRGETLVWAPSKLWIDWDDVFIDSLRDMYSGFYAGDDEQFREGLDQLNLRPAEELFRRHFGGDEQRSVDFDVDEFRDTFLEILRTCSEADVSLHKHFVPLGFYLVSLYDHLDDFDRTYDVRSAFYRAVDQVDHRM